MCSVVRRDGDQCPGHHLKVGVLADTPTGCSARIWMAPVEGTTEDSEVFGCQRKRRSTAMSGLCQTFTSVASHFSGKFGVFLNYF